MKKILITHISNTLNYGSAMMAINLIFGLRQHFSIEDLKIYCECDDYHLNRLKIATGDNSLQSYFRPKEKKGLKLFRGNKYLLGKSKLIKSINSQFKIMIVLGGDDLSEIYMRGAIKKGLIYFHINKKTKVILAGQSLGPFSGKYKYMASFVFKNIMVITRDDNSYNFSVNKLKLKNVIQSRDLALYELPNQNKFSKILEKKGLLEKKYIVTVPSGLIKQYTNNEYGYIITWQKIIKNLLTKYPNFNIIILGHVLAPKHADDRVIISKIMDDIYLKKKKNIIVIKEELQPAEARSILGEAKIVITGRMHAAVSTLFMGKPAISLAYSEKYEGVISKGLKLPELVLDCRNQDWSKDSNLVDKIMKKLEEIEKEYINFTKRIQEQTFKCSLMIENQIDSIIKEIKWMK